MLKLRIETADAGRPEILRLDDPRVQVWHDKEGLLFAYGYTLGGVHWLNLPYLASYCFRSGDDEVQAFPEPSARRDIVQDMFYRAVLPVALQALGQEVLHASAVRLPHGVLALCAASEMGKSTLAYGLSRRGFPLWADDALAFDTSGRYVSALPLPFNIRLRPASASFFGVDGHARTTPFDPARTEQQQHEPAPLAAICVLARDNNATEPVCMEQFGAAHAFGALIDHAYCFNLDDRERKRRMMQQYLELSARVPIFALRFHEGLGHLPTIIGLIERTLQGSEAMVL